MVSRVRLIRKELKMTQGVLGDILGITKSALSMIETGKQPLSMRNKNRLIQELNVNPEWLDTGEGDMFNANPRLRYSMPRVGGGLPYQSIPLYDLSKVGGLAKLFECSHIFDPVDYLHVPGLPKCDGAIFVSEDGMYPLLRNGDIVMYKQLRDKDDIFWGEMYLLSIEVNGDEYVTVKYVQKSDREACVKLVSQNSHFAEKDVELSRIKAIAFVKANVRMSSMR